MTASIDGNDIVIFIILHKTEFVKLFYKKSYKSNRYQTAKHLPTFEPRFRYRQAWNIFSKFYWTIGRLSSNGGGATFTLGNGLSEDDGAAYTAVTSGDLCGFPFRLTAMSAAFGNGGRLHWVFQAGMSVLMLRRKRLRHFHTGDFRGTICGIAAENFLLFIIFVS